MNDYDRAAKNIGNRFDLVLVASERMRELHGQRKLAEERGDYSVDQRRKESPPHYVAIHDIETGVVGKEYLNKVKSRGSRKRQKFDPI